MEDLLGEPSLPHELSNPRVVEEKTSQREHLNARDEKKTAKVDDAPKVHPLVVRLHQRTISSLNGAQLALNALDLVHVSFDLVGDARESVDLQVESGAGLIAERLQIVVAKVVPV